MKSVMSSRKKRRSACDNCHKAKVRCSGETTCSRCERDYCAHLGKPKGSLNKSTIERMLAEGQVPAVSRGDQSRSRSPSNNMSPRAGENDSRCHNAPTTVQGPSDPLPTISSVPSSASAFMVDDDLSMFGQLEDMDSFLASLDTPPTTVNTQDSLDSNQGPNIFVSGQLPFLPTEDRPMLCTCVQALTAQVNSLDGVVGNRSPSGLDETLRSTQDIVSCISAFLKCRTCSARPPAFFIANVVLSMTLDLILPLMSPTEEQSQLRTQIRIGSFNTSGQLGMALEKVVVQTMTQNLQEVVDKFETKIDFLSSETAHLDFLKYEAQRVKRGLQKVAGQTGFGS